MTTEEPRQDGGKPDDADAAFEAVFEAGGQEGAPGESSEEAQPGAASPEEGTPGGLEGGEEGGAEGRGEAGGQEGAPGGSSEEAQPGAGELEPADRMERTTLGRLKAAQDEIERLKQQLASKDSSPEAKPGNAPPVPAPAVARDFTPPAIDEKAIPEDLRDDFQDFKADYEHLAPYLAMKNKVGEQLRKVLREAGPHPAAAMASTYYQQDAAREQGHVAFLDTVSSKHPEVAAFKDPARLNEAMRFRVGVENWIKSKFVLADAEKKLAVVNGAEGPGALIALLDEYKQAASGGTPPAKGQAQSRPNPAREKEAQAAAVVRSRPSMPQKPGKPSDLDDPDRAFDQVYSQGKG